MCPLEMIFFLTCCTYIYEGMCRRKTTFLHLSWYSEYDMIFLFNWDRNLSCLLNNNNKKSGLTRAEYESLFRDLIVVSVNRLDMVREMLYVVDILWPISVTKQQTIFNNYLLIRVNMLFFFLPKLTPAGSEERKRMKEQSSWLSKSR